MKYSIALPSVRKQIMSIKKRVVREREKGRNPSRYYRRKYQKAVGCKVPETFDIHHLDGNWQNIDIDNLVAIPKALHRDLHRFGSMVVYMNKQFYIPLRTTNRLFDHNRKETVTEVARWIEYRNYLLGRTSLNLTGFSYD